MVKKSISLACFQPAPFAPVIAAVIVQFDFHVRLYQFAFLRQAEADVLDVQAAVQPLLLIIGTDAQDIVVQARMIQIIGDELHRKMVCLYHAPSGAPAHWGQGTCGNAP